jgi:hypothetical protein
MQVSGKVFDDLKDNYYDGEEVTIALLVELHEAPNYFVAVTDNYNFKLDKSQEVK